MVSAELIEWKDEYESGVEIIDKQHKDIINALNAVYIAVEDQQDSQLVIDLLKEFDDYINTHLNTEEHYAEKYHFSQTEELKRSHEFFRLTFNELRYNSYYHNGDSIKYPYQYSLHLHAMMKEWLIFHMNTIDKELAGYLKDKL